VPGSIEGTEGFERLGDLANMDNKQKANSALERKQSGAGQDSNDFLTYGKKLVPVQRYGTGVDIANTALFLASPAASYMTGTNIVIDGGVSLTSPNMMFLLPPFVEKWSSAKL
jgi:NAD(P)-dependent dehydrogenase (short-subunit alcohol dehydrogenase family)